MSDVAVFVLKRTLSSNQPANSEEFGKSVYSCRSYDQTSSVLFFGAQCATLVVAVVRCAILSCDRSTTVAESQLPPWNDVRWCILTCQYVDATSQILSDRRRLHKKSTVDDTDRISRRKDSDELSVVDIGAPMRRGGVDVCRTDKNYLKRKMTSPTRDVRSSSANTRPTCGPAGFYFPEN